MVGVLEDGGTTSELDDVGLPVERVLTKTETGLVETKEGEAVSVVGMTVSPPNELLVDIDSVAAERDDTDCEDRAASLTELGGDDSAAAGTVEGAALPVTVTTLESVVDEPTTEPAEFADVESVFGGTTTVAVASEELVVADVSATV